jgi:hypothetical protein
MFKSVVGHSNDPDSLMAITEVIDDCNRDLAGLVPQAGVLFAAIDFDHQLILQHIQQAFPGIQLIGGSTNGEISSILEFQQDSLTLMLFASDKVEIRAGLGCNVSQNPAQAVQQAIAQAKANSTSQPKLCLTFPESLTSSGIVLLEELQKGLGDKISIVGGMTADDYIFKGTYQFFQDQVLSDAIPILLFSGDLLVSSGVSSGWRPIGRQSRVTKVQGNTIYEIEGQRALDFYQYYLGAERFAANHAIHALAVFDNPDRFYLRAPISYSSFQMNKPQ